MTAEEYLAMQYEALDDMRKGLTVCAGLILGLGLLNLMALVTLIYIIEVHP